MTGNSYFGRLLLAVITRVPYLLKLHQNDPFQDNWFLLRISISRASSNFGLIRPGTAELAVLSVRKLPIGDGGANIFMPQTLKKLEGHIAFGLSVCVCVWGGGCVC